MTLADQTATPRILVVDDTPRNVKLLADLLSVKGYMVETADSGQAAELSKRPVIQC